MVDRGRPIGVFDSGIGGLTVLKEIMAGMPHERLVYFGDTARLPYGSKSRETVTRFAAEIVAFLSRKNPKMIVVACNTASAYSLQAIRDKVEIPVVGVISPGADAAVAATRVGKIGVIGTRATIGSGAYVKAIHDRAPETKVFQKACPLFVPLIEEGWMDHPVTRTVASEYLRHISGCGVDALILGCTHYPLLKGILEEVVGSSVTLVDSAWETARVVREELAGRGMLARSLSGARCEVYLSDLYLDLRVQVERFLGLEIPRIKTVDSEFEEIETSTI
jgi:glutamate racemase